MRRRASLTAIAASTALALVAACGSSTGSNDSSAAPKTELVKSVRALTSGSALTTTLSLATTGANIIALAQQGGGTGGPTMAQANLIAGARVAVDVQAPKGKTLDDKAAAANDATSVTVSSGDTSYVGLRVLNRMIYLQVDLKDILAAAGESAEYQTLVARVASFPAFVKALVGGKWISLPLSTISSLESLLKGATQGSTLPSKSQLMGLVQQLEATLLNDLVVTRASTGSTDHLAVSANLRTFARGALKALRSAIPALRSELKPAAARAVPNRDVNVDAFVTDGALSKASIDLGQFATKKQFTLPVVATFVRSGDPVTVPAGAVSVDFASLLSLFEAVSGSSSSSSGSGSSPAPVESGSPATASAP